MKVKNGMIHAGKYAFPSHSTSAAPVSVWSGGCRSLGSSSGYSVRKNRSDFRTSWPMGELHDEGVEPGSGWAVGRDVERGAALRTYAAGALVGGALFFGLLIAVPDGGEPSVQVPHSTTTVISGR